MAENSTLDNIVETVANEETNIVNNNEVSTEPNDPPVKSKWHDAVQNTEGDFKQDDSIRDNYIDLNPDDYRDELGDDIYLPEVDGINSLNAQRADNQAWYQQAGNFLGQAVIGEIVGGTIEGLGYMLDIGSIIDVMQGDEADWGNFITDLGQGIREGTQDAMQIHQDPNAQGGKKWLTLVGGSQTVCLLPPLCLC